MAGPDHHPPFGQVSVRPCEIRYAGNESGNPASHSDPQLRTSKTLLDSWAWLAATEGRTHYEDNDVHPTNSSAATRGVWRRWDFSDNPHNPDPDQWVVRGDRTVDSMCHFRMGLTYFDDEEEFEKVVQEREALLRRQRLADDGGE